MNIKIRNKKIIKKMINELYGKNDILLFFYKSYMKNMVILYKNYL
jgi:hypothetical protein